VKNQSLKEGSLFPLLLLKVHRYKDEKLQRQLALLHSSTTRKAPWLMFAHLWDARAGGKTTPGCFLFSTYCHLW
jgi:hypothetical protein